MAGGWADKTWTVGHRLRHGRPAQGKFVFEITTYRSEQYELTSRKPDVQYGRSLEEDLGRRDFTINAMAARLPGYEFVDPFGGLDALREKVLRTPGRPEQSFGDDPLRILRAARFAAKLGFTVAPEVRAAMTEQAARLEIVSAERITGELTKLMLTPDPALRHRRAGPDRRGRRGAARGVQAPDGGRRAPPAQGRLPAQPHRAAAGHRPRAASTGWRAT